LIAFHKFIVVQQPLLLAAALLVCRGFRWLGAVQSLKIVSKFSSVIMLLKKL